MDTPLAGPAVAESQFGCAGRALCNNGIRPAPPLSEKVDPILKTRPRIVGLSVSIWNHTATLELLAELERAWQANKAPRPVIVLGGPEVSHLPPDAAIFRHADYVIRGEGEIAFRTLCERILETGPHKPAGQCIVIDAVPVNVAEIKKCSHGGQGPGNNPRKRAFSPFPDPQKNTPEYSI